MGPSGGVCVPKGTQGRSLGQGRLARICLWQTETGGLSRGSSASRARVAVVRVSPQTARMSGARGHRRSGVRDLVATTGEASFGSPHPYGPCEVRWPEHTGRHLQQQPARRRFRAQGNPLLREELFQIEQVVNPFQCEKPGPGKRRRGPDAALLVQPTCPRRRQGPGAFLY